MPARILAIVLLALALAGGPFGMGRMMDMAHAGHGAAHQHHQQQPDHKPSTPHFMACAACAADLPDSVAPMQIATLTGALASGFAPRLEGVRAAPDLPPPRA